mmetsp:Transcript_17455/g.38236  ORF Transcript_17455/g.38236 Transcript_17455/m.38236 type:complete len:111 (-) Transcript_17455:1442-1774(-)
MQRIGLGFDERHDELLASIRNTTKSGQRRPALEVLRVDKTAKFPLQEFRLKFKGMLSLLSPPLALLDEEFCDMCAGLATGHSSMQQREALGIASLAQDLEDKLRTTAPLI